MLSWFEFIPSFSCVLPCFRVLLSFLELQPHTWKTLHFSLERRLFPGFIHAAEKPHCLLLPNDTCSIIRIISTEHGEFPFVLHGRTNICTGFVAFFRRYDSSPLFRTTSCHLRQRSTWPNHKRHPYRLCLLQDTVKHHIQETQGPSQLLPEQAAPSEASQKSPWPPGQGRHQVEEAARGSVKPEWRAVVQEVRLHPRH